MFDIQRIFENFGMNNLDINAHNILNLGGLGTLILADDKIQFMANFGTATPQNAQQIMRQDYPEWILLSRTTSQKLVVNFIAISDHDESAQFLNWLQKFTQFLGTGNLNQQNFTPYRS